MENKVYLLYSIKNDWPTIEKICTTKEIAEREKELLETYLRLVKDRFKEQCETEYDNYKKELFGDEWIEKDNYEELVFDFYNFQADYPEVETENIFIAEQELITE